jgi:hypothetical protein
LSFALLVVNLELLSYCAMSDLPCRDHPPVRALTKLEIYPQKKRMLLTEALRQFST